MALTVGQKVLSTEHPKAIGTVVRVNDKGDATIEFETPRSSTLPYGHIITEFWSVSDQDQLTIVK